MYVVVGLGNPGQRYAATRHNVGFMVIDELAHRWSVAVVPDGAVALGHGQHGAAPVVLAKPLQYMNRSGEALATRQWDTTAEWVVVHDDLDLPCGRLRVRRNGGTGGHRGIESLVAWRGADFTRVRVGISRPLLDEPVVDYVLAPFTDEEAPVGHEGVRRAADAVEALISDGLENAMNRFNQRASLTIPTN